MRDSLKFPHFFKSSGIGFGSLLLCLVKLLYKHHHHRHGGLDRIRASCRFFFLFPLDRRQSHRCLERDHALLHPPPQTAFGWNRRLANQSHLSPRRLRLSQWQSVPGWQFFLQLHLQCLVRLFTEQFVLCHAPRYANTKVPPCRRRAAESNPPRWRTQCDRSTDRHGGCTYWSNNCGSARCIHRSLVSCVPLIPNPVFSSPSQVYDISSKLWTTYDLAEPYVVSDHTGFAFGDQAFFCGGYNRTYAAVGTCFSLRIPNATDLEIADLPPLPTPRADVASVTYGDYALVSGGVSDGCAPRNTTERLYLPERTWTERADSLVARAGQVLVKTDDAETDPHLYALGGARPMNPLCTRSTDDLPRSETTLLNAVVLYDVATDRWSRIQDLSKSRWRFVAVGYGDTIYSFGGQRSFNDTCQCFPSSDEVTLFTEIAGAPTNNATSNLTSAASPTILWTAGVVTTVLTWMMMMTVIIK
jgi:hypothetical protein